MLLDMTTLMPLTWLDEDRSTMMMKKIEIETMVLMP